MRKKRKKNHHFFLFFLFFICYILYSLFKLIHSSVFFNNKERINIVFYGEKTLFFSLGKEINYFFTLPAQMEVLVPGGYGYYRLGAVGKLSFLEKNPDILRKTFSSITSCFIDLYFYSFPPKIYYDQTDTSFKLTFPSLKEIFFSKTNGNIFDRLFVVFFFINRAPSRYQIITDLPSSVREKRIFFEEERFFKKNQGLFYKKTYRNLKNNVQIVYTKSYKTAQLISRIIEGEGIRVVDISQIQFFNALPAGEIYKNERCLVIEDKEKPSIIAFNLKKFFNCQFKREPIEISDIILVLRKAEKEWEREY